MAADRIIAQDYEVASRLDQLGLSAPELIGVVHQAVAAKAGFVLNHPVNAAGQLSYIYGTGALRDTLRTKGWQIDRTGNIEATFDPKTGIKIVFLPERNQKDTIDIPDEVKSQLDLRFMKKIDDALAVALGDAPSTPEPEPAIPPPTAPSRGNVGERLPS